MAWHLSGAWDGASIQDDLPTIMAQIETAVIERENMIFGLSTTAKTAADFDGYTIFDPPGSGETSIADWIATIRTRIERLLSGQLISTSVAPAITDRFGRFTNEARDKILSLSTTGDLLSVFSLTDYTSGWISINQSFVSNFPIWDQLKQVLEEMVYPVWTVAPRTTINGTERLWDKTGFAPSESELEAVWDWARGATSAPTGGYSSSQRVYSSTNDVAYPSESGILVAGILEFSNVPVGLDWVVSSLINEETTFTVKTERIEGTLEASYVAFRYGTSAIAGSAWLRIYDYTMTHEGTDYTMSAITNPPSTAVVDMFPLSWPSLSSDDTIDLSFTAPPSDRLFDNNYAYFAVEFFMSPTSGGYINADSLTGTRVHTDITAELTYG